MAAALASEPEFDGGGDVRVVETLPGVFPLDAAGDTSGWGPVLDTRARLHGEIHWGDAREAVEFDMLDGQLAGQTWALSDLDTRDRDTLSAVTLEGVTPRKAYVGARFPWFDAEVGLNTSQWGLGLLANDGAAEPEFGRADGGDRVLRLRLATLPFAKAGERLPIYLVVAGDRVVSDELARLWAGDTAWQALAALLYARDDERTDGTTAAHHLGVYGTYRGQVTADGRGTRVAVADVYGDWAFDLPQARLGLAGEAALIGGHTDAARTYLAPEGLAVLQSGVALQARAGDTRGRVVGRLRGIWASGDRDVDDGRVTDFRADANFDAGFVLFDEVISQLDLQALAQASDPAQAAVPPDGVETLAGEGAIHAATAVQPELAVTPCRWFSARVGGVFAWSNQPIAQPFESFRAGGTPTNAFGEPTTGRALGAELDYAVGLPEAAFAESPLRPSVEVQVGHAWPSAQLGGAAIGRVDQVQLAGRLRF